MRAERLGPLIITKKEVIKMTKDERETREYKSLFTDERFAKKAWKELIGKSLNGSAKALVLVDPKTGEKTFQSQLEEMAYNNVKARLTAEGLDREPQQAELIVECNILRARQTDSTFNILLDRTAGKVKDEINVNANNFEELSDEEIEALVAFRQSKRATESQIKETND